LVADRKAIHRSRLGVWRGRRERNGDLRARRQRVVAARR
jgi:hypothetical protein